MKKLPDKKEDVRLRKRNSAFHIPEKGIGVSLRGWEGTPIWELAGGMDDIGASIPSRGGQLRTYYSPIGEKGKVSERKEENLLYDGEGRA